MHMNDSAARAARTRLVNLSSAPTGRIFVVTPGGLNVPGGIGRMISYFHRTWDRADAPLTIIDTYGPGPKLKMPFYFAVACARLIAAALAGRIGLLHVHMSERLSVLRKGLVVRFGSALGIPVVLHLHGAEFADYCRRVSPRRLARIKRMMAKADAVVTLGTYWRDFVCGELGVDPSKVAILHNAVPGPAALPERPSKGPCRIVFLGVVCERKGVPILLRALAEPAMRSLEWHADIAGNGEVDFFRAEAQRLGLAKRVTFHGWVDEARARQLLAASDILTLPSRNEGLPMAILEAMAYGLPIVATAVGSIADAIVDGESGLLVPVGDEHALCDALARLVGDPGLRAALGARAREHYLARFEISAFNARLAEIFRCARLRLPAPGAGARASGSTSAASAG
jgi:glycosyltransferase involved in cell wall biosynthesis